MGDSVFVVYIDRDPAPDVMVDSVSADGVTINFDFGDDATEFCGAYAERWQADLHALKVYGRVAEVPIKSY